MNKASKIFVAGHNGLVGSAIVRALSARGYENLLLRSHSQLDLTDQKSVCEFFETERPEYVFLAAAKVGGIAANSEYPADFIMINLQIECNVIHAAYKSGVKKLLFLGSSCIYPKLCPQPIKEEYLLTAPLEPSNEGYAIAKISGLTMCRLYKKQYGCDFISCMPTNLYGINDNFDLNSSHVLPAMIRKFHDAKMSDAPNVILWGTGTPRREFLHVDDLADGCIFLMDNYSGDIALNIGTGSDIAISELALLIKDIVGFKGNIVYDRTKPDGTPRKLLDVSRLEAIGWKSKIPLCEGIENTYSWFLEHRHLAKSKT